MTQDILYRGVLREQRARFAYAVTTEVANTAILAHDCDPLAAHILGRALGAAVLMSPLLNEDERYTLRWSYTGALRSVVVDVDAQGRVRGLVAPVHLTGTVQTETDLYGQSGQVAAIKSDLDGHTLNSGLAEAALLDVVDDLSFFFAVSDQVETAAAVLIGFQPNTERPVSLCQGVMLQAMPDCDLLEFDAMRQRLGTPECRALLAAEPQHDNHFELIVAALTGKAATADSLTRVEGGTPVFHCGCTRDRMRAVLKTLPADERQEATAEGVPLAVTCRFCGRRFEFGSDDLAALENEATD